MTKFWSKAVHRLHPYVPGEQPQDQLYIKLNTNENPYPPAPSVISALKSVANEKLRLYPDPNCSELKNAISHYYNLSDQSVFVGNGSDEVLAFAFQAFFDSDKKLRFPDISYSFYPAYCSLYGIPFERVPLNNNLEVNPADYTDTGSGVIIPNPNAPTGVALSLNQVQVLLETNKEAVVIIDEAYVDFGAQSAISLIDKYPNLLVTQTFSKSRSLAGLRCGFAIGHPNLIEALERVKNSFNSYPLDSFAIKGAKAAIEDSNYFEETCAKVISTRNKVCKYLEKEGFQVLNSSSNFLFVTHATFPAVSLYEELKAQGVLVRYFDKPRIDNYLRISIGTDKEMNQFLDVITSILKNEVPQKSK
ncbi:MAG: histidinol-phosphate transaminase [Gammaproteobacteria bacterium]|nr:histidinol-phosphate transaminase [Gammaproteobacteria bacterium]